MYVYYYDASADTTENGTEMIPRQTRSIQKNSSTLIALIYKARFYNHNKCQVQVNERDLLFLYLYYSCLYSY